MESDTEKSPTFHKLIALNKGWNLEFKQILVNFFTFEFSLETTENWPGTSVQSSRVLATGFFQKAVNNTRAFRDSILDSERDV